jgi:Holliday junction resolvase RusA-like endonuclease
MHYAIYLDGKPTAKGRAAPKTIKGKVRMFTPATTRHFEKRLGDTWTAAGFPQLEGPVAFRMIVSPQGQWTEVWEVEAVEPERGSLRSDLDNHIKTVDGLNGIAWVDDKQVVHITADKLGKA